MSTITVWVKGEIGPLVKAGIKDRMKEEFGEDARIFINENHNEVEELQAKISELTVSNEGSLALIADLLSEVERLKENQIPGRCEECSDYMQDDEGWRFCARTEEEVFRDQFCMSFSPREVPK